MASVTESKKEGCCGGRRHGPPTEEERQQREAEFKQEFFEEYRKRYGDALISAEQTWELFQAIGERRHAKKKEHRSHSPHHHDPPSPNHGGPGPHHGGPGHFEEKRKQVLAEVQQDFQKDFEATHGTSKINADQAWLLIQKAKQSKREKWEADRQKHGHGHWHGRRSPPTNE